MKFMLKLTVSFALLLSLGACSWLFGDDGTFRDRSNDYRKASVEPAIQLPDGIESESLGDGYAIPPISDRTSLDAVFALPKPDPLSDDSGRDTVRINTLDTQRWILIDGTPGQIWPRLRGFLNLNQLSVQRADAVSGIIETSWLQPSGEGALRERYRLHIDQGVQRGTSEIYVLQADIRAGEEQWPASSSNDERAKVMTTELAQYLADSTAAAAVSMLAQQALDSSGKITLEEDASQNAFIRLKLPFSRAWASVGRSLEKSGYTVDDLNRSEQVYYVHYQQNKDKKQKKGFFSRMFSWSSSDKENTDKGVPYLIKVSSMDDQSVAISIQRQSGKAMTKAETEQLLKQIKRNIA
jgi:outer membrane protein assembly factor BamC